MPRRRATAGRPIALRAPFVEQPDRSGAVQPPGGARRAAPADRDRSVRTDQLQRAARQQRQAGTSTRVDYQLSANHTVFGRYIDTFERRLPTLSRTGNVLTVRREFGANKRARAQSSAFGDTMVLGANTVNSFRVTWNRTSNHLNDPPDKFFDAPDLGIKLHTTFPASSAIAVTNAFTISGGNSVKVSLANASYQVGRRLLVGARAPSARRSARRCRTGPPSTEDNARAAGDFNFNGQTTGLALADFLTGQASLVRHGAPGILNMNQWYVGAYGQDTWRVTGSRHAERGRALGAVLRAERRERRDRQLRPRQLPARASRPRGSRTRRRASSIRATPASRRARPG